MFYGKIGKPIPRLSLLTWIGWSAVLGLTALRDSTSVYIKPSLTESEKEKRNDRGQKKYSYPIFH